MGKWVTAAIYMLAMAGIWFWREELLQWIERLKSFRDAATAVQMFVLAAIASLFPVIPFGVVGGIMGAAYGLWLGGLMNTAASTLGAALMFLAVRHGWQEQGGRYLDRVALLHRLNAAMEHRPATSVFIARMIPVLPAVAINVYAALVPVPFVAFLLATAAGKLPVMLVFAFIGEQLLEDGMKIPAVLLLYAAMAGGFYAVYRYRAVRRRKERTERS
ncbi:DedA family protein [Paenibacillus dendritiformis]|uniref:TVP38/TMEM64 family protein n=1 Tax=Paenibacillus dendritiformis TaxID=130049 RepID=UPI0010599ACF|nr:VTT domain-containing protein [Paenibacillus dendritiformis]TDL52928.1 DedA family protein [Paenibacillus dendritiformis]